MSTTKEEMEKDLKESRTRLLEIEKNIKDNIQCSNDYFKTLLEDWLTLRKQITSVAGKLARLHPHITEKHDEYERDEGRNRRTCKICGLHCYTDYNGNINNVVKKQIIIDLRGIIHEKPSIQSKLKVGNRTYNLTSS